jgi:hypothetical protein
MDAFEELVVKVNVAPSLHRIPSWLLRRAFTTDILNEMDHAEDVLAVVFDEVPPIALGRFGEFAVRPFAFGEKVA